MKEERIVVIMRHGEAEKNTAGQQTLTLKGVKQVKGTLADLSQILQFSKIFHSGHARTLQCATVAQDYLGLSCVERDLRFDYEYAMLSLSEKERAASMEYHTKTINTEVVAHGLEASEYVRRARKFLIRAILEVSKHGDIIAFSHSPLASFATPDPSNFPYHIGNADAVVYKVFGDKIIFAKYYSCPTPTE